MRDRFAWLIGAALAGTVACSDGGSAPSPGGGGDEGARLAARFDRLADSVAGEGLSPTAEAFRHSGEIVRLTGHATPVTLTIDGASRPFQAVAEQLDFPQIQCWWPADSTGAPPGDTTFVTPDSGSSGAPSPGPVTTCTEVGTYSMRTLIAWEPERMAEVVRLVADPGSNQVQPAVPDVMAGLPTSPAPDSAPGAGPGPSPVPDSLPPDTASGGGGSGGGTGGSPGYPGFMGEYLVGDQGIWFAVEGSQTNELTGSGGACTSDQASFDWAEFRCEGARFGYQFSMRLDPLVAVGGPTPVPAGGTGAGTPLMGSDPGGASGEHAIAMARTEIDGVRLTVVSWAPPPVPMPPEPMPPEPVPPDSAVTSR
jgi:hypothetical protein